MGKLLVGVGATGQWLFSIVGVLLVGVLPLWWGGIMVLLMVGVT